MQVHWTTGKTHFHLLLTGHPLSITLCGASDRLGTIISDERLNPVQYKRAIIQRLPYAMQRARPEHTAAQRRYQDDFFKKARFRIEVQACDQVRIDRLARKLPHPESDNTSSLTEYGEYLREAAKDGSRKPLPRTTDPYTVQSVTNWTVTIDKKCIRHSCESQPGSQDVSSAQQHGVYCVAKQYRWSVRARYAKKHG